MNTEFQAKLRRCVMRSLPTNQPAGARSASECIIHNHKRFENGLLARLLGRLPHVVGGHTIIIASAILGLTSSCPTSGQEPITAVANPVQLPIAQDICQPILLSPGIESIRSSSEELRTLQPVVKQTSKSLATIDSPSLLVQADAPDATAEAMPNSLISDDEKRHRAGEQQPDAGSKKTKLQNRENKTHEKEDSASRKMHQRIPHGSPKQNMKGQSEQAATRQSLDKILPLMQEIMELKVMLKTQDIEYHAIAEIEKLKLEHARDKLNHYEELLEAKSNELVHKQSLLESQLKKLEEARQEFESQRDAAKQNIAEKWAEIEAKQASLNEMQKQADGRCSEDDLDETGSDKQHSKDAEEHEEEEGNKDGDDEDDDEDDDDEGDNKRKLKKKEKKD